MNTHDCTGFWLACNKADGTKDKQAGDYFFEGPFNGITAAAAVTRKNCDSTQKGHEALPEDGNGYLHGLLMKFNQKRLLPHS